MEFERILSTSGVLCMGYVTRFFTDKWGAGKDYIISMCRFIRS